MVSAYGMTEVNIPLYGRLGTSRPGTAGKVLDRWFEVEVRDPETDDRLPAGEVGEIMVRPKVPFGFMTGYAGLPEATLAAWRSFWFHTGDSGVMDDAGWVTFVDRTKDCIRRRGENISSFEVESAIARLDGVAEVAAYAVPAGAEGTEDEVMLAVVLDPGAPLDAAAIAGHADAGPAALRPPPLRRGRRGAAEDADAEGPQAGAARAGRHLLHVGPGARSRERKPLSRLRSTAWTSTATPSCCW